MSIATQYLSLPQYAELRGSSGPTLKKLVEQAKGTQFDIGDHEAMFGSTKVWHIDKWQRLELFRLTNAINEAVALGFVMTTQAADDWAESRYNDGHTRGFSDGLEEGRKQGINHAATGSYEDEYDPSEDDE